MGRDNSWSSSNSTGTTDMGIWGEEDPVISSQPPEPLVEESEIKSIDGLEKYRTGIPIHKYPIYIDNLNSKNNVPIVQECIHFTAVKQGGISLQKEADDSVAVAKAERERDNVANKGDPNDLGENVPGIFKDITSGVKEVFDFANAAKGQNNTTQSKRTSKVSDFFTKTGEGAAAIVTGTGNLIKSQFNALREPPKNLEHCFLYMPNSVQFGEGASWGAESLGGFGNLVKQGLRGTGDAGDLMKNFSGGAITGLAKAVAVGAGYAAAGAVGAIGLAALVPDVGTGLRAAGRFTQNPYEEQLFNGIDFRTFTFDFAFAPSNETEAKEVENIIKMFRFHSRPNFVGGFLGEGLYTFPNEFNIEFLMNENGAFIEHPWIPSIYNCVCTNVSTNYSPEGFWVALRDGRPVSYTLSLAFTETKKITQQDVEIGY